MCLNGSIQYLHNETISDQLWERWMGSHYLAVTVATLSMIGSLLIVVSFCVSRDLRHGTSRRIVVYISIADFVSCMSNTVGTLHRFKFTACKVQAIFTTISTLSFLMWTTCLGVYLYVSLVFDRSMDAGRLMPIFHFAGWGIPLIVGVVSYCMGALGDTLTLATDGWCWVSVVPEHPETWSCKNAMILWMMITMKGWELASYIIVPALYIRARFHISKEVKQSRLESRSRGARAAAAASIDKKLLLVPIAYVFLRVWGTVRAFNFVFHRYGNGTYIPPTSEGLATLNYLQALGDNGQGLVNFLIFIVFSEGIQARVVRSLHVLRRWLCCCCPAPLYTAYSGIGTGYRDRQSQVVNDTDSDNNGTNSSDVPQSDDDDLRRGAVRSPHSRSDFTRSDANLACYTPVTIENSADEADETQYLLAGSTGATTPNYATNLDDDRDMQHSGPR